jgi:ABC-type sulfate/molybdate transport systems ATPase subunit
MSETEEAGELRVSLHKRLGAFQLAVDFQAALGLIVFFGASGAGKSLTLRGLAGLLQPDRGRVSIDGHLLFDSAARVNLPPQERRVGYVPQHYALFPHLTIAENVRFALPRSPRQLGWRKKRAIQRARVKELLTILELEDLERRYPATLSGGQQQRVALARALAAEPRLLLLDEPFNALDAPVRERLRDALKRFQRRFAIPIVLVTHDHAEAQQLADTIVVLQQGRVMQVGSPQEVFFAPRTAEVAQLVGQRNIFSGYLATPGSEHLSAPAQALRLAWLQNNGNRRQVPVPQDAREDRCWLPLPAMSPRPAQAGAEPATVTGCIFADEIRVRRWTDGAELPPAWTERGAVQWQGILLDAQISGNAMRLLVTPQWGEPPGDDASHTGGHLEVYVSRAQWRELEGAAGLPLLMEIGPEALHWFEQPRSTHF